jgi:hypothetical protein
MNRWKLFAALTALSCPCVVRIGSAQGQLTVDATKQLSTPIRGRGPFPGSPTPGHSPGLPIRLVLQLPTGDLRPDKMTVVDFLITNVGTEAITLPISIDCRTESTDILTLWLSSDAIKDQYLTDKQTGHLAKIEMVETSAQLCGRAIEPQSLRMFAPNETLRVHALSPPMNPGPNSFIGHAERLRVAHGASEVVGTSDADPVTRTLHLPTR